MPTPKARDSTPEGFEAGLRRNSPQLGTVLRAHAEGIPILGTLTTATSGRSKEFRGTGTNVVEFVEEYIHQVKEGLLPTPLASNFKGYSEPEVAAGDPKNRLHTAIEVIRRNKGVWGRFEPAITRWEAIIGRPAPEPTLADGKNGNHRLSPFFTEWLMGLPLGHITEAGLTRDQQIKACGNGVVPQQAELALRLLLQRLDTN